MKESSFWEIGDADTAITKRQLFFITIVAVVAITICSKSSPLYPLNDWVDANCFMTVGKSMIHGLVPYRDLIEQKGPLLYMIHAVAALISETSFLGVYFIEIAACHSFRLRFILQLKESDWSRSRLGWIILLLESHPLVYYR